MERSTSVAAGFPLFHELPHELLPGLVAFLDPPTRTSFCLANKSNYSTFWKGDDKDSFCFGPHLLVESIRFGYASLALLGRALTRDLEISPGTASFLFEIAGSKPEAQN